MKVSFALVLAAAASATATSIRKPSAKAALLKKARRLEDQGDDNAQEEYQFLENYKLKMIKCAAGAAFAGEDEQEYSSVIFRLCPEEECEDEGTVGCKSGYGDFIVGINTFVEAWLEDKREDMGQDDQFNVDEFSECQDYKPDNDDDNQNEVEYYVGPTCAEDGGIKLGFFSDYKCTTVPEDVTFEDISNGWSLPYSDGGLISTSCESCAGYNENGEYELSEMCAQLYEFSGKCMTNMDMTNTGYSANTNYCETIEELNPAPKGSKAGKAIGWTVFVLVVLGLAGFAYTKWWTKKKQGATMTSSDGAMA